MEQQSSHVVWWAMPTLRLDNRIPARLEVAYKL